jgi:LacI family transcriptional regulator
LITVKQVSIKDVARRAEVSYAIASAVLNGRDKQLAVDEAVTRRVRHVVQELGYVPNAIATSLRSGKSRTIALVVDDISSPVFSCVAAIIEAEARKFNYAVICCSTGKHLESGRKVLRLLEQQHIDGYIIVPFKELGPDIQALQKSRKPVVLVNHYVKTASPVAYVITDEYADIYEGVRFLSGKGYRRIGLITEEPESPLHINGYKDALHAEKIPFYRKFVKKLSGNLADKELEFQILQFLRSHRELEALLLVRERVALTGLNVLKSLKLNVPRDMAVLCYADHLLFSLYDPAISVIRPPVEEMALHAIQLLIRQLSDPGHVPGAAHRFALRSRLIVRESA